MTQWHTKSKKSKTGAIRTAVRRCDKRLAWRGGDPTETIIDEKEDKRKTKDTLGSTLKIRQKKAKHVAVTNLDTKKTIKAEIVTVEENKANRLYTRKNIITKGATITIKIDGKEQKARVTSRPGQNGVVQAVLEKK
tara:strand:+ start:180 stop:587 length:408 start_codon:yes stop_codon:yes gene_type:complete